MFSSHPEKMHQVLGSCSSGRESPSEVAVNVDDNNPSPASSFVSNANGSAITGQTSSTQLCRVCGDKASGKHYGVPSCDGCRGFFKRSIRRNLDYVCKENNSCIVDLNRRNQCQACRFRKCMEVKMNRDGESTPARTYLFVRRASGRN